MHVLFTRSSCLHIVFINILTHNSRFHILRLKKSNVLSVDKILVLHAGTAPGINRQTFPGSKVGVRHFLKYLDKFPENKVIIAHMGGYEYEEFFKIAEQNPNIYLDTAMVWVPSNIALFPETDAPSHILGDDRLLSFMEENSRQILFGSDFPNIPYNYESSINELLKLKLSKQAFENIFYKNAMQLFKLPNQE